MTEPEQWRPIAQVPDYSVSSLGRVRRDSTGEEISRQRTAYGYKVTLYNNRERHQLSVRGLMAQAFFSLNGERHLVRLKDGNPHNLTLDNFEVARPTSDAKVPQKWEALPESGQKKAKR